MANLLSTNINGALTVGSGGQINLTTGGDVGIGTTAPSEKLVVYAAASARPTILVGPLTSRTLLYSTYNSQDNTAVEVNTSTTNGFAGFTMSNSNNTSGNTLGVVTFTAAGTAASEKRGALIASSLDASAASNVTANLIFYTNNAGTLGERMRITSGGQIRFNGYSSTSSFPGTAAGLIGFDSSGNLITVSSAGGVSGSGTTNYVARWTNSSTLGTGVLYDDGTNVGIGTTNPTSKLHVYGGMTTLRAASSGQYDLIRLEDNAGSAYGAIGVNTSGWMYLSNTTGGTQHFVLTTGGNVGIGTTSPSTKLEVIGTITCTTLVETSSIVAKTNVRKLSSQKDKISKLSPVSFNYKNDNKRSLGLIAEEVAQVYPELVEYDGGQPLGVNYSKLTAVLISTVNELVAEVAELKKQLNK